ncbi:MAG: transcriptional repressor [Myxococcales bacterium]|nr:transcriptional repressor [Myxococcales bacterium]|tara:strand:+ start:370 stop:831 length:462 start_codon:yes stop_codon:yes gene_type:complete
MLEAAEAIEILTSYLAKSGLKMTSQRRVVTEAFFDPEVTSDHPTAEELYLRVRERDSRIGYATVYRSLKILTEAGLASPGRFGDNQTRYEPESPGEHHDHFVCTECGKIVEFEDDAIEKLQIEVAAKLGFELTDHKMVLFGKPNGTCKAVCKT